jgi:hypothetical protein
LLGLRQNQFLNAKRNHLWTWFPDTSSARNIAGPHQRVPRISMAWQPSSIVGMETTGARASRE